MATAKRRAAPKRKPAKKRRAPTRSAQRNPSIDGRYSPLVRGYIFAALDEAGRESGRDVDSYGSRHIAGGTLKRMVRDCDAFLDENVEDLYHDDVTDPMRHRAGIAFWRTRNGDRSAFNDMTWTSAQAKRLAKSAAAFGPISLYERGDGFLTDGE